MTEYSLTEIAVKEDTTSSCSAGKREHEFGIKHCEGSFSVDLDLDAHPMDDPPNINVGSKIAARFYDHASSGSGVGTADGTFWDFTTIGISNLDVTNPSEGKITYSYTWESSGAYTNPSENAGSSGA